MAVKQSHKSHKPSWMMMVVMMMVVMMMCLMTFFNFYASPPQAQAVALSNSLPNKNRSAYGSHEHNQKHQCPPSNTNITFMSSLTERTTKFRHKHPPLLISFGGSGNTFVRLLIEYITKIYTGSIYRDEFRAQGFLGSGYSSTDVSVIKIHGEHFSDEHLKMFLKDDCKYPCFGDANSSEINTVAAIFIMRDPWPAMFALYNLWIGGNHRRNRHQGHIPLDKWMASQFEKWLWKRSRRGARPIQWMKNVRIMNEFASMNQSFLVITFENLVHHNLKIRINELLKLTKYLYNERYFEQNEELFTYRIQCVWNISQTDSRMTSIHRSKPNELQLNKTYAYNSLSDTSICRIWNAMKSYAVPLGYANWNNIWLLPFLPV
eukprot:300675_1